MLCSLSSDRADELLMKWRGRNFRTLLVVDAGEASEVFLAMLHPRPRPSVTLANFDCWNDAVKPKRGVKCMDFCCQCCRTRKAKGSTPSRPLTGMSWRNSLMMTGWLQGKINWYDDCHSVEAFDRGESKWLVEFESRPFVRDVSNQTDSRSNWWRLLTGMIRWLTLRSAPSWSVSWHWSGLIQLRCVNPPNTCFSYQNTIDGDSVLITMVVEFCLLSARPLSPVTHRLNLLPAKTKPKSPGPRELLNKAFCYPRQTLGWLALVCNDPPKVMFAQTLSCLYKICHFLGFLFLFIINFSVLAT